MHKPDSSVPRIAAASAALVLIAGLTGCAHVNQEDLDSRLSGLREDVSEEIAQGDRQVRNDLGQRMDGIEDRLDGLVRDLDALEREFDATVERLQTALRFNMPVHFGFDEATLRSQDEPVLERFSQVAQEYYPDALITVEGFTDPAGSEDYNMRLGQRRAEAVKSYLVNQATMKGDRIRTVSYGESTVRQVADGAAGPGREGWENRRVVLVIDHGGAAPAGAVAAEEEQLTTGQDDGNEGEGG